MWNWRMNPKPPRPHKATLGCCAFLLRIRIHPHSSSPNPSMVFLTAFHWFPLSETFLLHSDKGVQSVSDG